MTKLDANHHAWIMNNLIKPELRDRLIRDLEDMTVIQVDEVMPYLQHKRAKSDSTKCGIAFHMLRLASIKGAGSFLDPLPSPQVMLSYMNRPGWIKRGTKFLIPQTEGDRDNAIRNFVGFYEYHFQRRGNPDARDKAGKLVIVPGILPAQRRQQQRRGKPIQEEHRLRALAALDRLPYTGYELPMFQFYGRGLLQGGDRSAAYEAVTWGLRDERDDEIHGFSAPEGHPNKERGDIYFDPTMKALIQQLRAQTPMSGDDDLVLMDPEEARQGRCRPMSAKTRNAFWALVRRLAGIPGDVAWSPRYIRKQRRTAEILECRPAADVASQGQHTRWSDVDGRHYFEPLGEEQAAEPLRRKIGQRLLRVCTTCGLAVLPNDRICPRQVCGTPLVKATWKSKSPEWVSLDAFGRLHQGLQARNAEAVTW